MKTWTPPQHLPGRPVATPYNVPTMAKDAPAVTIPTNRQSTPSRMPIYVDQELLTASEINPEIIGIHLGAGQWEVETEDYPKLPEYSATFVDARSGARIMLTFFTKESRDLAISMTTARRKVLSFGDKTAADAINKKIQAQEALLSQVKSQYMQNTKKTAIGVGILATLGGLIWWYKK